jgi:uncharacterized membrane protein YphA (DoxX/SURF4 family)
MRFSWFTLVLVLLATIVPVAAHEVYVLNATTIRSEWTDHGVQLTDALASPSNRAWFVSSVLVGIAVFALASYLIHTKLAKHLDERFDKYRGYAHLLIRVGLGSALLWGAIENAAFGPEIPLDSLSLFGIWWQPILLVIGTFLILGLATRLAAIVTMLLYAAVFAAHGHYALTYLAYFGEAIVMFLETGRRLSLDKFLRWPAHIFHTDLPALLERFERWGERHGFAIIRVAFGIALVYAAISIKMLHPSLSLEVLTEYNLDFFTSFAAIFIVLCAAFIELFIGFSIILGVFYRIVLVIMLAVVSASVWYFGEAVWPHLILLATGIGLFLHGLDEWCLEEKLYARLWGWTKRWRKSKSELSPE